MTRETEEKLAGSLTAETTEILPFLPYLLQDFWELGSDPKVMRALIKKHVDLLPDTKALDLACGKGAVSVRIAESLGIKVKGVDMLPEFVEYAKQKADEYHVADLCEFIVGDINEAVKTEKNYDIVVFGAAGNVLGTPIEMLAKLKSTIKTGGYILIDEAFLPDGVQQSDVKCNSYELFTESQWAAFFKEANLELIETDSDKDTDLSASGDSEQGMKFITKRVNELIAKHPDKKEIFKAYERGQQDEYDDIENTFICVTWVLKKL